MKTVTLIGATGLIGSHLLELLKNDEYYKIIKVLVRRPVQFNHPKINVVVVNFSDADAFKAAIQGSDAVFCSIGTTNSKVKGDKVAYRKVDYDIPVNAAKYCVETGCNNFLLVSSVGANAKSTSFYLRLKGEVEDKIKEMNIASLSVLRPSMLLGKRDEFRLGEKIAKILTVPVSFLFPSKFKPIKAENVARAMIVLSKKELPGFNIYHYNEIHSLLKK